MSSASPISIAATSDVPKLVDLVNKAYRGETSKRGWTTEAHLLDGIRTDEATLKEMMARPESVFLKYTDDTNALIGCVYLQKQETQLYLGMLTVSPQLQAKGIGKQLLQASEDYGKQHHCATVIMTVISVRTELISWYERNGYSRTGEKKPFPADERFGIPKEPLEFIVLQKNI